MRTGAMTSKASEVGADTVDHAKRRGSYTKTNSTPAIYFGFLFIWHRIVRYIYLSYHGSSLSVNAATQLLKRSKLSIDSFIFYLQ